MRIFVMLLVLVPMVSFAKCETPIDCYKQALEDLQNARAEIKAVKNDVDTKMESIDRLISQYQAKLEETTKQMTSKYKGKLDKLVTDHEAMEKAYKKKLDGNDELSALSLKAIKDNQAESQKLLEELGISGEEVKKLTDTVSVIKYDGVSEHWNVLRTKGVIEQGGADFRLGQNDGRSQGKKHANRALVHDVRDELVINYSGDFEGGVRIDGPKVVVAGNLKAKSFEGLVKNLSKGMVVELNEADKIFFEDKTCGIGSITAAKDEGQASICACVDAIHGKGWYCVN